ncbi:MAG: hypothetical protein ABEI97_02150 [Candidatus Nanohaloarchaea archaeon]
MLRLQPQWETPLHGDEREHGMRFHRRRYAVQDDTSGETVLRFDFRYPLADGVEEPEYVIYLDRPPESVEVPDDWTDGSGTYTAAFTRSDRMDDLFHDALDRYDDACIDDILDEVKEEMLGYAYEWSTEYVR